MFAAALALGACGARAGGDAPRPPNVLLIADDSRAVQGCYGGAAQTPNIDRLALARVPTGTARASPRWRAS